MVSFESQEVEFPFAVVTWYSCGFVSRENTVRKSWSELRLCHWLPICLAALPPMRIQSAITVKRRSWGNFFTVLSRVLRQTNKRTSVFWNGLSFSYVFVNFPACMQSRTLRMTGIRLCNALQCQWLANGESPTIVANRVVRSTFLNFYAITTVWFDSILWKWHDCNILNYLFLTKSTISVEFGQG